MKKILLVILMVAVSMGTYAQKCKIKEKNSKDGEVVYMTKLDGLLKKGMTEAMAYSFTKTVSPDTVMYMFFLFYNHSLTKCVIISQDNFLSFNLDNGEVVKLKPIIDYEKDRYGFHYNISVEQLRKLSENKCTYVSCENRDKEGNPRNEDWIIKESAQEKLMNHANCMLNHKISGE